MIYFFTFIGFILFVFLINRLYKNTNFYKNKFIDTYKFKDIPCNLDIVNLGSSLSKFAFDYSQSNILGMNLAIGPQSFQYDFKILKQYHTYLKKESKVIIPISLFSFFFLYDKRKTAQYKYYKFLLSNLIDNYSKLTKFLYIDFPVLTSKKQILRIIKDVKPDNRFELESNPMNNDEIKKDAQNWLNGWKKQFQISDLENIILSDENKNSIEKNIEILKEMINFCLDKDYEPVLLVFPTTKESSSLFPDEFVQKYITNCINQSNENNIRFLNYWKDERFESKELYFNSFFMNKNGRLRFTAQVMEDLAK